MCLSISLSLFFCLSISAFLHVFLCLVFRAADWLFSHPDDLDFAVAQALGGGGRGGGGAASGLPAGASVEVEVDPLTQRGECREQRAESRER